MGAPGDPGLDEELPPPRSRAADRRRLVLGFVAGSLLLVALIARALAHGGGSTGVATGPSASRPLGLPVATEFVTMTPVKGGWLPRGAAEALHCRADCVTIPAVSDAVREAIADAFPGARVTSARTVRLEIPNFGRANWSLRVDALAGDRIVLLQVRGSAQGDRGGYEQSVIGGYAISRFQATLVQYHVLVQVVAPAGEQQARAPLERLAGDVRLLGLW